MCCLLILACVPSCKVNAAEAFKVECLAASGNVVHGSGVAVGENLILTCAHVAETDTVSVIIGKKPWKATVLKRDEKADLALLSIDHEIEKSNMLDLPSIRIMGHNMRVQDGKLFNDRVDAVGKMVEFLVAVGDPAKIGISGSPLFVEGRLIGVVKRIGQKEHAGCVIVVPINIIEEFIKR